MARRNSVDEAIANIEKELARPQQEYAEREWFARVKSGERTERIAEREWSGASWGGHFAGGSNLAGGRER
jgi:hypothetical protein